MDRTDTMKLLDKIAVHYPSFKVNLAAAEEWERLIGYMDLQEALDRLDDYLMQESGNNHAPGIRWFKRSAPEKKQDEVFHAPIKHTWHLEFLKWDEKRMHGRCYDQDDYEYVHDPTYEDGYHYDQYGRICTIDGRVAFS